MPRKTTRQPGTRHYVNYKPEVLEACLRAIKSKSMTQRVASAYYKIPRVTIKNKLKKVHGKNVGRPITFSAAEEISFAQHCTKLADFGFPLIAADLKLSIKSYLDNKGVCVSRFKNNTPGDDWVYGFLKRHPDLSVKVSANIKKSHAKITADDINGYMDRLEKKVANLARRGSNEIASCVFKDLMKLKDTIKTVTLYSDSCAGQNKNSHIVSMFFTLLSKKKILKEINHKFLELGNTHMECDCDHSLIEKQKKKSETIVAHPRDWATLISCTNKKKPFHVDEMKQSEIYDSGKIKKALWS